MENSSSIKYEKKFECPYCNKNLINREKSLFQFKEYEEIECTYCKKKFTYIVCSHCKNNIYFKSKIDKIIGYNINCDNCHKFTNISKCDKCKIIKKHNKIIEEGKLISCENCKLKYIYYICPIQPCNNHFYLEEKEYKEKFPDKVLIAEHYNEFYQKLNCCSCKRPIAFEYENPLVYDNNKKYIEGQKIKCPYLDCQTIFNRIICPKCKDRLIFDDGVYKMGIKIKCGKDTCKTNFSKIICPKCLKISCFIYENNNNIVEKFREGYLFKCNYCELFCRIINCVFCKRINYFDKDLIVGQIIQCGYDDCKGKFHQIVCPFCKEYNVFKEGEFFLGKKCECKFKNCLKKFCLLICSNCKDYSLPTRPNKKQSSGLEIDEEYREGINIECRKCKSIFLNLGCKFCKKLILIKGKVKSGKFIKCPHCLKEFCFITCPKCQRLNYSEESIEQKCIKCSHPDCNRFFIVFKCSNENCEKIIIKETNEESKKIDNIKKCKSCRDLKNEKKNEKDLKVENIEILKLEEIKGKSINYQEGKIDDNYLSKQEDLIKYKNPSILAEISGNSKEISKKSYQTYSSEKDNKNNCDSVILQECSECHNSPAKSAFIPCGHTFCYSCALKMFSSSTKRCRCKEKIRTLIKEIRD